MVNPRTSVSPDESTATTSPVSVWLGACPSGRHDHDDEGGDGDQQAGPDADAPGGHTPVPLLPGVCSGIPSAQRGQVAAPAS